MPESERAKEILTEEVREAAGDEAAGRARERLDQGDVGAGKPQTVRAVLESNRLLLLATLALALMVGVIAALAVESWWIIVLPLLMHGVLTAVVVAMAMRMTTEMEKPDPVAEAELEEEGVADPEGALDRLVKESSEKER